MITRILSILSVIANIMYFVVLRMELYTRTATFPSGQRTYHYSPLDMLYHAGNTGLKDFQFVFSVISVILVTLLIVGIKNRYVKIAWIISTAASTILFIAILVYAGSVHLTY